MFRPNALWMLLALGCSANSLGEEEKVCAPGMQVACACPGGQLGAQSCTADGMAYTKCDCSASSGVGGGGWGTGGSPSGGNGGAPEGGGPSGGGGSGNGGAPAGGASSSGGAPSGGGSPGGGSSGGASSGGGSSGGGSSGGGSSGGGAPSGGSTGSGGTTGGGGWGGNGGFGGGSFGPVGDYAGNVKIQEIALYQAVKIGLMKNGQEVTQKNAPVVAGRPALVRVFVAPVTGFTNRKLTAKLELTSTDPNVKSQTVSLDVSAASTDSNLGSTFNFLIPPEQVTTDLKLTASLHEPSGASVGATQSTVKWPAQTGMNVGADSSGVMRVKFVPFRYKADGSSRLPDTSTEQMQRYHDILFAMYPTTKVEVSLRDAVDYNKYVSAGSGWSTWLDTLCDLRQADKVDSKVYYFGIMAPAASWGSYGGGIAGLGYVPDASDEYSRCAVGLGFKDADTNGFIMAHEVGHTMGRPHAPCGVSGEAFPYSGATIGAWGYSLVSQKLKEPSGFRDVMSYCDPQWISDVNYGKLFKRIKWVNANYYVTPGSPEKYRKLLVDPNGTLSWGNSITFTRTPSGQKRRVALLDGAGQSVAEVDGYFVPTSDDPAGTLYVPEPRAGVVAIAADGLPPVVLDPAG
ncbi:MAG: hypothetical protein HS104_26815 [Polyangiaceae bacterium]|nr:hypothetical protein [Polyangiaceae bacterium]MCL4750254.1 hypothetical protein [Myxococcales bacterium]